MDIRTELKNLMETKNYTTAFVAQATGISKSTISLWIMIIIMVLIPKLQIK